MSTQSSIFTFDHGQKKLNKAIGIEESYMDDLQEKIADTLKNFLFDENKGLRVDSSPSELVEACLHNYSYNQLVLMSSFFMQHKLEEFSDKLENLAGKMEKMVKTIAVDSDDMPPHIKDLLLKLISDGKGISRDSAINGDDLPQELKDFLDGLAKGSSDED